MNDECDVPEELSDEDLKKSKPIPARVMSMNDNVLLMNKGHLKQEDKIDFTNAFEGYRSFQLGLSVDNRLRVESNKRMRKVKTKKSNRSARRLRTKSRNKSSRKSSDVNEASPFPHKELNKISSQNKKSQFYKDKRNRSYLIPSTGSRFTPSARNIFFFSDKNVSVPNKNRLNHSSKLSDFAVTRNIQKIAFSKRPVDDDFIARDLTMKDIQS